MSIQVLHDLLRMPARHSNAGHSSWTDLFSSVTSSSTPIAVGIWRIDSTDDRAPIHAEWDETKYVISGETTIVDVNTGKETVATAGSLLWIPKGSVWNYKNSKGFVAIYVESRAGHLVEFTDTAGLLVMNASDSAP